MPQFDVFHVVEDGVQALSLVDHLVGWDENELRVPVDEFLDEPWAGDPVDLDVLALDPFHAILHFALHASAASADQYLGRCETAHCRACSATSGMAGNSWAYEFVGRRGRNRTAGKASFLHPGLVFLRRYLRDIISVVPRAQCRPVACRAALPPGANPTDDPIDTVPAFPVRSLTAVPRRVVLIAIADRSHNSVLLFRGRD